MGCTGAEAAVEGAQVVILAAPDTLIGRLAAEISPLLARGTRVRQIFA
jgi:ribosomal protein L13